MQILGFKPYHLFEAIAVHGVPHTQILKEAVTAQYNRLSGVKRYSRVDCEKWMAGYDVSLLIPNPVPFRTRQKSSLMHRSV